MKFKYICLFISITWIGVCEIPEKPSDWDHWSFSEKIEWRGKNLDSRIPYAPLVDKVEVKERIKNHFPVAKAYFVTKNPKKITLKKLPDIFMMKANNASGRGILVQDSYIIARRKRDRHFKPIKVTDKILQKYAASWLKQPFKPNIEKQYGLVQPKILFEEYLKDLHLDLYLFSFYGKVRLIAAIFISDYKEDYQYSFYDPDWNLIESTHPTYTMVNDKVAKPKRLEELISWIESHTQNIDHVRVDFSYANEDIYFGEFTFTSGQGTLWGDLDQQMGSYWLYPEKDLPHFGEIDF